MDPFEQNFDKPLESHEFDPITKSDNHGEKKSNDDFNDYFANKPNKIIDTIDFLNAETGRAQEVATTGLLDISDSLGAGVEDLTNTTEKVKEQVESVGGLVHAKVSENPHEELGKRIEDNDLLGLSTSSLSFKEPILEPVKAETTHAKDLLFDEKEQDELKGFDQYTSDSNASLKVNLSCENDDTASTKSIDSAQSIPLDEKKNLIKENLIEDAPEILSKISEDTLVNSSRISSPTPKESKLLVDSFESEFPSQEPPTDTVVKNSSPKPEEFVEKEVLKVKDEKEGIVPEVRKVKSPVKKAASTEMFIGPHEVFSRFGLGKCTF